METRCGPERRMERRHRMALTELNTSIPACNQCLSHPPHCYGSQHLANNPCRFLVRHQQLLTLLPLLLDAVILVQQLAEQVFSVQFTDETILNLVAAVVHQEVHDGLGDLVGDRFSDDVKVRADQSADEFGLEGLAFRQSRFGSGVGLEISGQHTCTVRSWGGRALTNREGGSPYSEPCA